MSQLRCIETIRVENKKIYNLDYHNDRLNNTRNSLWGFDDIWDIQKMVAMPDSLTNERYKLRIAYQKNIEDVRWELHTKRIINSIKIVYDDLVDYSYKYDLRPDLNNLFEQREGADEILIIKKNMVTDAYFYNVAFFDGQEWHTPNTPLLPGTQRAFLIDSGVIKSTPITEQTLTQYTSIRLFNALTPWETAPELSISQIS